MPTSKVAISLDTQILKKLDKMVEKKFFPNRSKAIQEAILEKIIRMEHSRLAMECAKLDKKFEQAMADEGISLGINEWPEY